MTDERAALESEALISYLRTENATLRQDVISLAKGYEDRIADLNAEFREQITEEHAAYQELNRENKRLLLDNAELSDECDMWQKKVAECWHEIERLRSQSQDAP